MLWSTLCPQDSAGSWSPVQEKKRNMMTTTAHKMPTVGMEGFTLSHGGKAALSPRFPRGGDRADRSRSGYALARMARWPITASPAPHAFHWQTIAVSLRSSLHRGMAWHGFDPKASTPQLQALIAINGNRIPPSFPRMTPALVD